MKQLLISVLIYLGVWEALQDTALYHLLRRVRDKAGYERHQASVNFYRALLSVNGQGRRNLSFDIGANDGSKLMLFGRFFRKIIAVEPDPNNFSILERRLRFRSEVVLHDAAVGSKPGQATLVCAGPYSTVSEKEIDLLSREEGFRGGRITKATQRCQVRVTTLDELILRYGTPDYIKIDVEGFELEVFKGLSQAIDMLSFEANLPSSESETIQCIERYCAVCGSGEFNYVTGEPPGKFECEKWLSAEMMIMIICHREIPYMEIFCRHPESLGVRPNNAAIPGTSIMPKSQDEMVNGN